MIADDDPVKSEDLPRKRRARKTFLCMRCRRKKAKCDRQLPCDQCIRSQCPSECYYDSAGSVGPPLPTLKGMALAPRLDQPTTLSLKPFVGINPMVLSAHEINMHQVQLAPQSAFLLKGAKLVDLRTAGRYRYLKNTQRTLNIIELLQQDPSTRSFWTSKTNEIQCRLQTLFEFPLEQRLQIQANAHAHLGPTWITASFKDSNAKAQLSAHGTPLGLSHTLDYKERDPITDNLARILPHHSALMAYIALFFEKVYPVYPVIDEAWALENFSRVLEFDEKGQFLKINILSRDDLIFVSCILFMIRLAYLSCLTNVTARNKVILATTTVGSVHMAAAPVTRSAVDLAFRLYDEGQYRGKSLFMLLQASILRVVHHMLSLENDYAYSDLDGTLSCDTLVRLARNYLLERDPDELANISTNPRDRNLRRKVWFTIIQIDYAMSCIFSVPKRILPLTYDTKLPEFSPSHSNIQNLALEERTIAALRDATEVVNSSIDLFEVRNTLTKTFPVHETIKRINDFEITLHQKLGFVADYFDGAFLDPLMVARLRLLVSSQFFLVDSYYALHLFYRWRADGDLAFFFLKKNVSIVYLDFSYFCTELQYLKSIDTFHLMMSPILILMSQLKGVIGPSLSIILNGLKVSGKSHADKILLDSLIEKNELWVIRSQHACKTLSERYFHAWKLTKANAYGYSMVYEDKYPLADRTWELEASSTWTTDQVREIYLLIPSEAPIRVDDVAEYMSEGFTSAETVKDKDLSGTDLYRTIQTDIFWVLNMTLQEYEAANINNAQAPASYKPYESDLRFMEMLQQPAIVDPNTSDVPDLNFFTAGFSMNDFFPFHGG